MNTNCIDCEGKGYILTNGKDCCKLCLTCLGKPITKELKTEA